MKINYGIELIIDLHHCDPLTFTRKSIKKYLKNLCELIDMQRADLHWWDFHGVSEKEKKKIPDHLMGTSVIQFITTSNITIHTIDRLGKVYFNIFSCKQFNIDHAREFTMQWFKGEIVHWEIVKRV